MLDAGAVQDGLRRPAWEQAIQGTDSSRRGLGCGGLPPLWM